MNGNRSPTHERKEELFNLCLASNTDKPTMTCPDNYTYHDYWCYRLINLSHVLTRDEASSHCYSQGAMLALPRTLDQLIFLQHIIFEAGVEQAGLGLHNR